MKKSTLMGFTALSIMICTPALAESPFDGTWKADVKSTQLEEKPIVLDLKDGTYHCRSCTPAAVTVKADGKFHRVTGQPYYDELAVHTVDDRKVKMTSRKAGKVVGETVTEIAADGSTATYSWSNVAPDGSSFTGKALRKRVAAAAKGAHALSGAWTTMAYDDVSENGTTVSFKVDGDTVHMSTPAGESYVAKFDGPEVPVTGDLGGTKVKVRKLSDTSFEETNIRDGRVVGISTIEIDPSGKKMQAVYEDKLRGSKMRYTAHKQ
jgi:hypothetical protein